ncbi:hypothetical protein [Streptomyces tsukubensis]|uniref:Uncharacterized protein n=1 Tax=Streptomyces tsukubensis TaxID=83656 RepID=A0A1V4AD20_9ACTN|nr:hypothetical protein [Streptomyces tsukubensis]OON81389.1 hypothetical protein B1H18_08700 [Streptomyces tsukubensis]QFR95482.1 hypothetical protein GBW32_23730 [Streptomyces tsukubensis]
MTTDSRKKATKEDHFDAPWWWGLGPIGAAVLVLIGIVGALWLFLRLPGTPEEPTTNYYGVAKVVAIGLVVGGGALLARFQARGSNDDA